MGLGTELTSIQLLINTMLTPEFQTRDIYQIIPVMERYQSNDLGLNQRNKELKNQNENPQTHKA